MTDKRGEQKVLIVGSSHTGAFYTARERIKTGFPGLEVSYFGMPGRIFSEALFENGILRAADAKARKLAWMDRPEIDFAPFSLIIQVGERFTLNHVMRLMAFHDVLEEAERSGRAPISSAALTAFLTSMVQSRVDHIVDRFGADDRYCILPAPYPLARSTTPGPKHEYGLTALSQRGFADQWMTRYEAIITTRMQAAGLDVFLQPHETRAGQFMTQDRYARPGTDITAPEGQVDHRHMNSDYGWQVFCALAEHRLGLTPEGDALSTQQKMTG
ncbi:hypothetical protein [Celeribacter naphthalenivorans]|uniref:hypothetical protein n=1 Tax=Celeribacter naphthalenivorans TaxID=1614694 RepID=UPI001CFAE814|nr:hypothetical protein [Celeribacter naphthalenivorans]